MRPPTAAKSGYLALASSSATGFELDGVDVETEDEVYPLVLRM